MKDSNDFDTVDLELHLLREMNKVLKDENERLRTLLNSPELHLFSEGVVREAAHQRERWGSDHDAGKEDSDWFWLVGYLAGKILHALKEHDLDKACHHCISTAAALANWHASINGVNDAMRPGVDPVERGYE